MEYDLFNDIVVSHRNSMMLIGILTCIFCIIGVVVVEIYVRRQLECKYLEILGLKFSPTLLLIIPLIVALIIYPIRVNKCNLDIENLSYKEYIGRVEYTSSAVKFVDDDFSIFVGKGHKIIPNGKHYGRIIYSENAKVIVFYEEYLVN